MPCSMTGFARGETQCTLGTLVWEIRSVNHRYLEPHFRIPDNLRELEPKLRDILRNQLSRGKVETSFHLQSVSQDSQDPATTEPFDLNLLLIQQLSQALEKIQSELPASTPINPVDILRWPGVVQEKSLNKGELLDNALALFEQTLKKLIEHRQREGDELKNLIVQRLENISQQVLNVRRIMPDILAAHRQKLREKMDSLKVDLDPERLEQEMVLVVQKADVDEELDRLDTHVTEVYRTLNQPGSIGRRLDFLMQELNREANTLSSKSIVSDTTQAAVELKVLIEQMREQIQNIE